VAKRVVPRFSPILEPMKNPSAPTLILALVVAIGCHTEPFDTSRSGSDQPFAPTPPIRLTFNPGPDRGAAWLPDGSGILYSALQPGRQDKDVCLALLPPGGGTQRQLSCDLSPNGDSTDAIESPAPTADGSLVFVGLTSRIGALSPDHEAISVAPIADPSSRIPLQSFPYTIPGDRQHSSASQLHWLGPRRVVYLAERVDYGHTCNISSICADFDTTRTGVGVAWLDLDSPGTLPRRVPGADYASGVSVGATDDEIYYTLLGDTRVFRQRLSSGAVDVLYDFGSAGIARDPSIVGSRLAAVVGGRVAFGTDPAFGPTQWDSGGALHLVDLQARTDLTIDAPGMVRRPQISPSGSDVVAEVYPVTIVQQTDTLGQERDFPVVSHNGDLYLFGQP
jgi:hypothetical protein